MVVRMRFVLVKGPVLIGLDCKDAVCEFSLSYFLTLS